MVLAQLRQRELAVQQTTTDLTTTRRRYQETMEENGRLEARIQAFTVSALSKETQLSAEVQRREDVIQKLKTQQVALQQTVCRQQDQVDG